MHKIILLGLAIMSSMTLIAQKTPFNPPFKDWDIPYETWSFDSERGIAVKTKSGTEICISPNALVDAHGKSVKGIFELYYRDMFNTSDLVLSGANMSYGKSHLDTEGMFDVGVRTLSGDPLYLKNGNIMRVTFPRKNDPSSDKTTFFAWDPSLSDWQLLTPLPENRTQNEEAEGPYFSDDEEGGYDMNYEYTPTYSDTLLESLGISQFGTYNYDHVIEGVINLAMNADIHTDDGYKISTVNIIYPNMQTTYCFSPSASKEFFFLIKDKPFRILAFGTGHNVYYYEGKPYTSTTPSGTFSAVLKKIPGESLTREQLISLVTP